METVTKLTLSSYFSITKTYLLTKSCVLREKKQIRAVRLREFQMIQSAAEAARNINFAFGEGAITGRTL